MIGKGSGISFEMFSSKTNELDNGDYRYADSNPNLIRTFDDGFYAINYNSENGETEEDDFITGGTISVSKDGEKYSITIDCIAENGKKITGFYKGILQYIDGIDEKAVNFKLRFNQ